MTLEQYEARQKQNQLFVTIGALLALTITPTIFFLALLQHGAAIAGK